jgi:hypothetical protein
VDAGEWGMRGNAASYGIYAETIRQESYEQTETVCYGIDESPFTCRVSHPDTAGEYCFPPLASLITGGARLKLALQENSVKELGGTYAMEDTDSMAIVATKSGGLVPCLGGPHRTKDGREAVKALSWKQVSQISERFAALNPYDRSAVPVPSSKSRTRITPPRRGVSANSIALPSPPSATRFLFAMRMGARYCFERI